jgi:hypothetical protein
VKNYLPIFDYVKPHWPQLLYEPDIYPASTTTAVLLRMLRGNNLGLNPGDRQAPVKLRAWQ